MDEKGLNMDPEVKNELSNIESRLDLSLQKSIQTAIKDEFRELKNHIAELFNKDIDHINDHLSRHDKYHEEHYNETKKIWKSIDMIKVSHDTAEKIEDKQDRKKELSYGKVGVLVAIASLLGGGVVYLINI
jgi:chromosome segregation ATPase